MIDFLILLKSSVFETIISINICVVAKVLDYGLEVSEIELRSNCCIYFRTTPLNLIIPPLLWVK